MLSLTTFLFLGGLAKSAVLPCFWSLCACKIKVWETCTSPQRFVSSSHNVVCECVCCSVCVKRERHRDNIVLPEIYQRQQDCFPPTCLCFFLFFIPVSIFPAWAHSIQSSPSSAVQSLPPTLLSITFFSSFSQTDHQLHFITSSLAAAHQTAFHQGDNR